MRESEELIGLPLLKLMMSGGSIRLKAAYSKNRSLPRPKMEKHFRRRRIESAGSWGAEACGGG